MPILATGIALTVLAASASAQAPALQFDLMSDAPGDIPQSWNPPGSPIGGGQYEYIGSMTDVDGHWQFEWDVIGKPDPFVSAGLTLINTFNTTLTFTVVTTLPIDPPIPGSTLMGGSTGGSLTDANFNGVATIATAPGDPLYAGLIDSASVLSIYPDPTSFSVSFAGQTVNIPAQNVGLPGPTIPGPPALSTIGIQHKFTLTPGDRVSFTSFFVVIPEPGSAALWVFAGVLALLPRRR